MIKLFFITFLLIINFISNCSFASSDHIATRINNTVITNIEVQDRYELFLKSTNSDNLKNLSKKIVISQIIEKMIEEELIRQQGKKLNIDYTQEEVDVAYDITAFQRKQTVKELKLFFKKNQNLHQSFLKKIESEIIWSKIVNEIIKPKITISEIELQEFFEQNHLVNDNKKFLIYEIVLPNSQNSFEFAKRLLLDLKDGADFKELIKQFSSSASLERNGEIGWVSQNEIDPKIYDAISKLNKNDYSEVLLLKDGYHIFKLEDIKYSQNITNNKNYINAKKVLFNNKLENLGKGYIVDLRRRSYIELY